MRLIPFFKFCEYWTDVELVILEKACIAQLCYPEGRFAVFNSIRNKSIVILELC